MGEVLASLSKKTPLPSSVVILEILVTRRAIQFVLEIGIHYSIFFKATTRLLLIYFVMEICLTLHLIT